MFRFKRFTMGLIGSNTYILYDDESLEGMIIDVGNPPGPAERFTAQQGISVRYIVLTHAHYDHICYIEEYKAAFPGAETVIHPLDNIIMPNPRLNCSSLFGSEERYAPADREVREGDVLKLGGGEVRVLHTPGHTEGSICLLADGYLFTGDTLFYNGFGRTDLGCGNTAVLADSIERIYSLDPGLAVFPGHGIATTVGREAKESPFLMF